MRSYLLAVSLFASSCLAVTPDAVYGGGFDHNKNDTVKLLIANGGAGQSGLIKGKMSLPIISTMLKRMARACECIHQKSRCRRREAIPGGMDQKRYLLQHSVSQDGRG